MQTRHRVPQVFNLSMVDVLCCALGSIILLWLLNSRDAKDRAREAGSAQANLKTTRLELARQQDDNAELSRTVVALASHNTSAGVSLALRQAEKYRLEEDIVDLKTRNTEAQARFVKLTREQSALLQEIESLKSLQLAADKKLRKKAVDLENLLKQLALLKELNLKEKDNLDKKTLKLRDLEEALAALKKLNTKTVASLAVRTAEKGKLEEELADLRKANDKTETTLVRLTKKQRDLLKELADLKTLNLRKKDDLSKKNLELEGILKQLALLKKLSLDDRESLRLKALELSDLAKKLASLRLSKGNVVKRLRTSEGRVLTLEKDLNERKREVADARANITGLQHEKKVLAGRLVRERAAADNRFAGITLTGKRVIFLVDMSGSMELVDPKTKAPDKWVGVRNTLTKIMRSLPDLEKFQVIVFSEKASYLQGKGNRWLDYDVKTSPDSILKALAAIKPDGGTNMFDAFQAAFRFRRAGLDTIYVLSDGLPNLGEGLTEEEARKYKDNEQAQSEILSKYIRNKLKTDWNKAESGKKVRINAIGFFYESPDVGAFLWAMARENDGSFVGMSKP